MKIHCSNCGKETSHTQRGSATETEELEMGDGGIYPAEWTLLLVQCDGCGSTSLYVVGEADGDLTQLYPYQKNLSAVPERIRNAYKSAEKIINISPEGFCVLTRRALEAICDDQEAKGKDLNEKLNDLNSKDIIPATLLKMSHKIRTVGNAGAHMDEFIPNLQDARIMDEFFLAVTEYVYIVPEKLQKVEQRLKGE